MKKRRGSSGFNLRNNILIADKREKLFLNKTFFKTNTVVEASKAEKSIKNKK